MTENDPVNVVIVEDHAHTRRALCETLSDAPERVRVIESFCDAESMLEALPKLDFDVALIDLGLPMLRGDALIERLDKIRPGIRSIALTVFGDEKNVLTTVQAGAYGYLLKDEPAERLLDSIEDAAAGRYPFSSRVAGILVGEMRKESLAETLTEREEQLAKALAEGLTYAECAARMEIKLSTVQSHVKRLYRKLQINSRQELKSWARRHLNQK